VAQVGRGAHDDTVLQFVEEPEGDLAGEVMMEDDEVVPATDASPFGKRAVAAMIEGAAWLLFCISGVEIVRWRENARGSTSCN
jgi:hypothetical protein